MANVAELNMVNAALAVLGQNPVADLSDAVLQGSVAASKVLRHLTVARDVVLARHGWVCALEYTTLSPAVIAGYSNWRYPTVYQLPTNALRVWEIGGVTFDGQETCWGPRWQVGTVEQGAAARLVVRAKDAAAGLNVAYVRRANWASLDPHVADAIAHELAARAAYSVTGDKAVVSATRREADARIILAVSVDGTQEGGQPSLAGSIPAALRNRAR